MTIRICETEREIGEIAADRILTGLEAARAERRAYLLGCPTGRTPRPVYEALAARLAAAPVDLSPLRLVMMDEYLVEGPEGPSLAPPGAHFSCRGFAEREIRAPLDAAVPPRMRLAEDAIWFPDPADPEAYDARIDAAGGLDLFLVASGASDGHVAFNPPGSPRDGLSRIVTLAEATRRDNLGTFPDFRSLEEVPARGVSVGLGTIASARAALLLLWGAGKSEAFVRIRSSGGTFDPNWPATIAQDCPSCEILADRSAAGEEVH